MSLGWKILLPLATLNTLVTAIVLVTVVTVNAFDQRWEAVLIASASMVVIAYVIIGVAPRTLGRCRRHCHGCR